MSASLALVLFGLPTLFRQPPPQETPIAVQLVTIAPETRATQPNPFKPKPEAKPEPPLAAAGADTRNRSRNRRPSPRRRPPPPRRPAAAATAARGETGAARPPPAAKAEPKPLPLRRRRRSRSRRRRRRPAAGSEHKPKPKPEPQQAQARAAAEAGARPKPEPKPSEEAIQRRSASCSRISKRRSREGPARRFDSLLKNLTKEQTAQSRGAAAAAPQAHGGASPPSSQPKAPLGSQLTASEIDVCPRSSCRRCWNMPAGARDAKDLVVHDPRHRSTRTARCGRRPSSTRAG